MARFGVPTRRAGLEGAPAWKLLLLNAPRAERRLARPAVPVPRQREPRQVPPRREQVVVVPHHPRPVVRRRLEPQPVLHEVRVPREPGRGVLPRLRVQLSRPLHRPQLSLLPRRQVVVRNAASEGVVAGVRRSQVPRVKVLVPAGVAGVALAGTPRETDKSPGSRPAAKSSFSIWGPRETRLGFRRKPDSLLAVRPEARGAEEAPRGLTGRLGAACVSGLQEASLGPGPSRKYTPETPCPARSGRASPSPPQTNLPLVHCPATAVGGTVRSAAARSPPLQ